VSLGEAATKPVVKSFCVAGVALGDILMHLSGNPTWFQLNQWWTNAVVSSMGFPWMSLAKYSTSIIWSAWPGA